MKLPEYQDFAEKKTFFEEVKIESVAQFDTVYKDLKEESKHLLFRGLREARFKNFTSGQREWLTNNLEAQIGYVDFIQRILDNIKNNSIIRDYYLALKVFPNDLLYLSFLQHYGSPTPMLDFTHDLDIALFFAYNGLIQNGSHDSIGDYVSLYYIDKNECGDDLIDMIGLYNRYADYFQKNVDDFIKNHPGAILSDSTIKDISKMVQWGTNNGFNKVELGLYDGVYSVIKLPLSDRSLVWANLNLIAQNGCFINFNKEDIPLEQYFAEQDQLPLIHCVDIPKAFEKYVKMKIKKKHEDIFPQEEEIARNSYHDYLKTF